MKKLEVKIPIIQIVLLMLFMIIVNMVIKKETEGYSEIFGIIYSLSFFITNNFYSIILALLLIIPLPLLIFSIIKKRKDLIMGFSISTLISSILIIIINYS